jgi:eukaryotic-like serine/threonine-protein kinase
LKSVAQMKPSTLKLGTGMVIAGKYRLETLIGSGGMGEVWVATNLLLESKVALKVLLRSLVQDQEAATRLLREARAAARVNHHNIIQVFDFGYVETGEPFIVMELLHGENLGDRLERAVRIPAVTAVEVLVPVAHALATAHAKGIVHRDLKPWNIFLSVDESNLEVPKVVDFGIAKTAYKHDKRVTADGHVLGSPEYLSPEQGLGEDDIDARADIWALCVTLYETITGKLPFEDEVYNRLLRKIVEDAPVPITDHAAGDEALWKIIEKGLEKKREQRWSSAEELGAALEGWLEDHGVFTTGGLFRRASEFGTFQPVARAPATEQIKTANGKARARASLARKAAPLVAVPVAVGVAALAWAILPGNTQQPASSPTSASALQPPASALIQQSSPAVVASPVPVPSAPPSATDSTKTPPAPSRTAPAATPVRPGKTKSVPAIPTEPNF